MEWLSDNGSIYTAHDTRVFATQLNLVPEEYGGDLVVVPVSAKTGEGVEDLLEYISLTAELEDLRADPKGDFSGVIIEGKVDKQAGVLATVMVQEGTLHVGDFLVVGENYGKIKAMTDSNGARIKEAGPSTPVQILGFSEVPTSGDKVQSAKNEHAARDVIAQRASDRRDEEDARQRRKAQRSLEDILGPLGQVRTVNLILRADTQGSVEAIQGILARKESDDVKINVMLAGIGAPTEGDVLLASTAEATILCFSVTASGGVKKIADTKGVDIKSFRIIYELIDEVDRLLVRPDVRTAVDAGRPDGEVGRGRTAGLGGHVGHRVLLSRRWLGAGWTGTQG